MLVRAHPAGWIPALAGLWWFLGVGAGGWPALLFALPGSLLLAGGLAILLLPGDLRAPQLAAVGGALGLLLGLFALLSGSAGALLATALSAAGFTAAGWVALAREPEVPEVPPASLTPRLAAKAAVDEALLASMLLIPVARADPQLAASEVEQADGIFGERGWLADPQSFHEAPPALAQVEIQPARRLGFDYEHLRFESGFEPHAGLPGRERWLAYRENHTAHAWLRRHPEPDRPWLVGVHGFGMGHAPVELVSFRAAWLHDTLGVNVALPVLPVHGPRSPGGRSGAAFMLPTLLNAVHAEAQAVWDLRRLISWLRAGGATRIGVYGLSLGGYTTALLAGLEPGLSCVVAGVPPSDLLHAEERFGTFLDRAEAARLGIDREASARVLRVVSPLAVAPKLPRDARYLFGGTGDRLVPPGQVRDLWLHWERPRMAWAAGGHVSAVFERAPRELLAEAFRKHLL